MSQKIIDTILERGVAEVIVKDDLRKKLESGKSLTIKLGIDPTGFDLTLGHAVVLRKLRQFQDAGHNIVLLFGTFTARIGDPTGKSQTRKPLTKEEILENSKNYIEQASKILDTKKIKVVYNGDWLEPMTFEDILKLAGNFTVAQMLERDMFQERIKAKREINMVEFLYPLMQGYDSVAIKADVEIGGTDQFFNLMCGRPIQKSYDQTPQNILTVQILEGTDGVEKMSKSLGNYIALMDEPKEIFGKLMSIPDALMPKYFETLTDIDLQKSQEKINANPRDAKVFLAKTIITWLHDETAADMAEKDFIQKFVKKEIPDEMPEILVSEPIGILDLLSKTTQFAPSNSEARRLVQGGSVSLDGEKITDPKHTIDLKVPQILKVGKRKFARLVP